MLAKYVTVQQKGLYHPRGIICSIERTPAYPGIQQHVHLEAVLRHAKRTS